MKILFICLLSSASLCFGQKAPFLKDVLNYRLGASVNPKLLNEIEAYREIVSNEFTSLTAENHMKMMHVHPEIERFDFSKGDEIVNFGLSSGKRIHGHTLVWHNQVPQWMKDFQGNQLAWENLLKTHIQTVVKHYKGKVSGWDVVNEDFLDDGSLRPSIWAEHIPNYIAKSFQWAHDADPEAILFYNDYGQDGKPLKKKAILSMVKDLKQKNIPIHGLGLQMHININSKQEEIEEVIKQSTQTGLVIHFSELDIAVNPKNNPEFIYDQQSQSKQSDLFNFVFMAFQSIPASLQYGVTFWNVADKDSWLRGYFKRPKEFPLLFDDQYSKKQIYQNLYNQLKNK